MTESENLLPEILEDFLQGCIRIIREKVGDERVCSIVLAGSFGGGEGTCFFENDRVYVLSDFDIYLIVDSRETLIDVSPARRTMGRMCEESSTNVVMLGGVDIGVVSREDLSTLPSSPGTYQFKHHSRILWGDGGVLDMIPDFSPSSIPRVEAVILVENRIASMARSALRIEKSEGRADGVKLIYDASRVYTDIATAALILGPGYAPGYLERLERIKISYPSDKLLGSLLDEGLIMKIEMATRGKLDPLAVFEEVDNPFGYLREAIRDAVYFWKDVYENVMGKKPELRNGRLRVTPASQRGAFSCMHDWLIFVRSFSVKRAAGMMLARNLGCMRYSPFDFVRFSAVELMFLYTVVGEECRVVPHVGGFPYGSDSLKGALAEVYYWWGRFVHGQDEERG